MTTTTALEITEANFESLLREYNDLSFSMAYRALSPKDAARHLEIEKALEEIA